MEEKSFAGFWQRAGAFIIDGLILGILGISLGQIFYTQFVDLGPWGRFIGFAIAAAYFTILNSSIGNGQTIGKAITRIKVTDLNGDAISFPKAFLRYSVLGIPFLLNKNMLMTEIILDHPPISIPLVLLVFGIPLVSLYMIIFNRTTRQTLHDLLLKTYVIKKRAVEIEEAEKIWTGHYIASSIITLSLLSVAIYAYSWSQTPQFLNLDKTRTDIQKITKLPNISIQQGKQFRNGTSTRFIRTSIIIGASLKKGSNNPAIKKDKLIAQIAHVILTNIPDAKEQDIIVISFLVGYDIGIANSWRRHSLAQTPLGWQNLINKNLNHI